MKLKRFVRKAQAPGAFSAEDVKKNSPQLYSVAKNLSIDEIKKLILSSDFVPLDLVALIYNANPNNFLQALQQHIMKYLRANPNYKRWLEQMEMRPEDASSTILTSMLNDDPNNRGVLNQVVLDGSRADRYRYEKKENSDIANALKNSLQSTQNQLVVPHCPHCKAAGIDKPLWSFEVDGDQIKPKAGMDNGHCNTEEALNYAKSEDLPGLVITEDSDDIQVKKLDDGTFLVSKGSNHFKVQLSENQKEELDQGLRAFEITGSNLHFRCTFQAKIPSFSAFLGFSAIMAEMSRLWNNWKRQHGRSTDLKRFERLKELEDKSQSEGLTPQEQKELRKERRYKEKRDKAFIPSITRLDAPVGEGATRTRQDEISADDYDFSEDQIRGAEFELEQFLDEEDLHLLDSLKPTGNLFLVTVNALKTYFDSGSAEDKSSYQEALFALAKFYIYGPENKATERRCLSCGTELPDGAKSCRVAAKMQKDVFDAYQTAASMDSFDKILLKSESPVLKHYDLSNVRPFVDSLIFTSLEITEDDIHLSFDHDEEAAAPKLNFNDFKARALAKLSPEQAAHFNGTNLQTAQEKSVQTEEVSPENIKQIAKKIDRLIRRVDEEDLLDELITYFRA